MTFRRVVRIAVTVSILALALALAVASPISASPATTARGAFAFLSDSLTPIRIADGNVFLAEVASIEYSGDLTGTVTATDTIIVHRDGSINGGGIEACASCSIGGRTGSFAAVFEFSGSAGHFAGTYTFTEAGGGLRGLRGQGTFEGDFVNNSYAYDYHFDP